MPQRRRCLGPVRTPSSGRKRASQKWNLAFHLWDYGPQGMTMGTCMLLPYGMGREPAEGPSGTAGQPFGQVMASTNIIRLVRALSHAW